MYIVGYIVHTYNSLHLRPFKQRKQNQTKTLLITKFSNRALMYAMLTARKSGKHAYPKANSLIQPPVVYRPAQNTKQSEAVSRENRPHVGGRVLRYGSAVRKHFPFFEGSFRVSAPRTLTSRCIQSEGTRVTLCQRKIQAAHPNSQRIINRLKTIMSHCHWHNTISGRKNLTIEAAF